MIINKINVCTRDPVKFSVDIIRENYEAEKVYGSITFVKDNIPYTWDFGDVPTIDDIIIEK